MKVLVTGTIGHLGFNLIKGLLKSLVLSSILVFTTISCQGPTNAQPGLKKTEVVGIGISGVKKQDYMEGEVLVKFRNDANRQAIEKIIRDLDLEIIKVVSVPNLYLLKIRSDSTVQESINHLKQFEEVDYSEPNYIRYSQ